MSDAFIMEDPHGGLRHDVDVVCFDELPAGTQWKTPSPWRDSPRTTSDLSPRRS